MSKQYRVCSDKSPAQFIRNQPEKPTFKIVSKYIIHMCSLRFNYNYLGIAAIVMAKFETFEENAEAGKPFFLSDVVCCVRVEELENPVMIQYASHTDVCIQFSINSKVLKES